MTEPEARPYERLLLCVDFGEDADTVCARAVQLAQLHGAEICLLHVVEHIPIDSMGEFLGSTQVDIHEDMMRAAESRLQRVAERFRLERARCVVSAGYTRQEIVEHAHALECDLIVVGSHSRHGLALLLGSTAGAVLQGARCDVLAVRV
ncbi:MAG: universal stress protein [Ectothiorhodospiraceae bacterium]|nr:universal stress protein [Ectothiorhodospiraceae bacterium]